MKQLTVQIPDSYLPEFIEFLNKIPNASILYESDYTITPELLAILNKVSALDNSKFYTIEESNKRLQIKYDHKRNMHQ
jgi:hypothetical protein